MTRKYIVLSSKAISKERNRYTRFLDKDVSKRANPKLSELEGFNRGSPKGVTECSLGLSKSTLSQLFVDDDIKSEVRTCLVQQYTKEYEYLQGMSPISTRVTAWDELSLVMKRVDEALAASTNQISIPRLSKIQLERNDWQFKTPLERYLGEP